jgi:hypothetical protein
MKFDQESESKKFFQMRRDVPVCLLHRQPNCQTCTNVYVEILTRPIIRKAAKKLLKSK